MWRFLSLSLILATPVAAAAEPLGLGRPATEDEIAAWDIDIRPDGVGLPKGSGDVLTGETLYTEQCAVCHGVFGEGSDRWPVLMGGFGTLDDDRPVKTIGSYWPYLSTVFDYVHRAMPFGAAQSLTDDEVYAITAYLLYLNDLVDDDFVLSDENLGETPLPNEDGFFMDDRDRVELPVFSVEPCMTDCKETVEIAMRAAVLDVTPDDASAREAREGLAEAASVGNPNLAEPAAVISPDRSDGTEDLTMTAADPMLVTKGEALFRQCQACHEVGEGAENRVGPHLNDVIGRVAGGLEGFRYSPAMASAGEAGLVWDAVSLAEFLADPKGYMKGTRMAYRGLGSDEDIQAMIAYLATLDE